MRVSARFAGRTARAAPQTRSLQLSFTAATLHYRFGLNTAGFILCARCGVYLGGVMQTGDGAFTTSNVNTLIADVGRLREPLLMHYGAENKRARRQRRQQAWTPMAIMI